MLPGVTLLIVAAAIAVALLTLISRNVQRLLAEARGIRRAVEMLADRRG
jgi:hypothetical protein